MDERMDKRRSRGRSRRPSALGSRDDLEQERTYIPPDQRGLSEQHSEDSGRRPYRHYERGRPLPSHHSPEPKACVPFRTVNLGIPSQRRSTDTFIQETWRSDSPQRYTYHSNFRGRGESLDNSPSRHYSQSPEHPRPTGSPPGFQRQSSQCRGQIQHNVPSHSSSRLPSQPASGRASRRSSPSHRRESLISGSTSTSRASLNHACTDLPCVPNGWSGSRGRSRRESRCPSQISTGHGLDSERLYRNLETLSRHGSLVSPPALYDVPSRSRTAVNSSADTLAGTNREISPHRSGHPSWTKIHPPDGRPDPGGTQDGAKSAGRSKDSPPEGLLYGATHSMASAPFSRSSSPPRQDALPQILSHPPKLPTVTMDTDKENERSCKVLDRSRSNVRRGLDAILTSEPKQTPAELEEVGMTIDDYIVLADIPRVSLEADEEYPTSRRRTQSPSPRRDHRTSTGSSYQSEINQYSTRRELDQRGRGRERGRDRREKNRDQEDGGLSRQPSATSMSSQGTANHTGKRKSAKARELCEPTKMQLGPVRFQGWMSKLDTDGKWRKYWFVLDDVGLRYYRDLEAEESDDLEGEIDLVSCVNVSDCEVERSNSFQIHTKKGVFTFSSTTRRNWVKLLKQAIQNHMHQSDTGSEKEDPLSQRPSSCQPAALRTCRESSYESSPEATGVNGSASSSHRAARHPTDRVDQDLPLNLSPANQREAGEGWDREQAKRLEERNKWFEEGVSLMENSRWDSMELKKGCLPVPVTDSMDSELNRKWAELERVPFTDMTPQSLIGTQTHLSGPTEDRMLHPRPETIPPKHEQTNWPALGSQSTNPSAQEASPSTNGSQTAQSGPAKAFQKEVSEVMEVDSPCGPGAPCRARIQALLADHRDSLKELQEKHLWEIQALEAHKDKLLQDESHRAASAMEALKRAHREEMKRHMEKARNSATQVIRGQVCSELSPTTEPRSELCCRDREVEVLLRENQELKTRLAEEISRLRGFITGQSPGVISPGHKDHSSFNVDVMETIDCNS